MHSFRGRGAEPPSAPDELALAPRGPQSLRGAGALPGAQPRNLREREARAPRPLAFY